MIQKLINFDYKNIKNINQIGHRFLTIHTEY